MDIGIRLHDTAPGTLEQRLDFAKAQGFSCVHLALSKTIQGFQMTDAPGLLHEDLACLLKDQLRSRDLRCAVLGCYLTLAEPDPEKRRLTQEIYKAHLRFAAMMGALMVGTETPASRQSSFNPPAPESEEAFTLLLEGLRPVVRYAEEVGAVLAVEPVSSHIVSTPLRAQRLLEALGSDSVRIILDAVNLLSFHTAEQEEAIVSDAIHRLGDRVAVLHMKDYVPAEGGLTACACGTGRMRFDQLLSFAKARSLPMTLENTTPENAEQARLHLERLAACL